VISNPNLVSFGVLLADFAEYTPFPFCIEYFHSLECEFLGKRP
jgi:hypothetical protein